MRVIWESSFSRRNDIEAAAEFFESDGRTDPALSKFEFAAVSSEFCRRDGERLITGFASLISVSSVARIPVLGMNWFRKHKSARHQRQLIEVEQDRRSLDLNGKSSQGRSPVAMVRSRNTPTSPRPDSFDLASTCGRDVIQVSNLNHQACRDNFAIGDVMIYLLSAQMLAGLI
jgi:hypothetical protein